MTDSSPSTDVILQLPNDVVVRRLRPSDAESLSHHGNSPEVSSRLRDRFPSPYTLTAAEEWIAHTTSPANFVNSGACDSEKGNKKGEGPPVATHYGIVIAGEACGGIGLEFGSDIYHRTAELGYWLSPFHWGKGHMSAIVPAFVQWAWRSFGILVRLNAAVTEDNLASRKVLEKAGFEVEGRRVDAVCKGGRVGAEVMLGALRPRG